MTFGGSNRWNWLPIPLIAAFSIALYGEQTHPFLRILNDPTEPDLATLHHLEVLSIRGAYPCAPARSLCDPQTLAGNGEVNAC